MSRKLSVIASGKDVFEGAGALHFHKEHLADFLGNYKYGRNLKIDSVYYNSTSDHLHACVRHWVLSSTR